MAYCTKQLALRRRHPKFLPTERQHLARCCFFVVIRMVEIIARYVPRPPTPITSSAQQFDSLGLLRPATLIPIAGFTIKPLRPFLWAAALAAFRRTLYVHSWHLSPSSISMWGIVATSRRPAHSRGVGISSIDHRTGISPRPVDIRMGAYTYLTFGGRLKYS
jgi:hypothetical protein